MSPEITIKKDYVLIEPKEGTDYLEIQRGVGRLFYVDEIPERNRIWVFREGPEKFTHDDLHKLRDIIKENYPDDHEINKTAIVVESDFQSSMAESFRQVAKDLPFEVRVFSDLQAAEDWVKCKS
ncbi:MAG: STAS/SEC14 domain-containing protein [Desulfobacterales bacterium]|jgi:hypothetical protein